MVGQYHRFNRHELAQTPGDNEGQGGLVGCSPQGCKESDTTQQLNNRASLNHAIPPPQAVLPNPFSFSPPVHTYVSPQHLPSSNILCSSCLCHCLSFAVFLHQNRSSTQGFLSDFFCCVSSVHLGIEKKQLFKMKKGNEKRFMNSCKFPCLF